MPDDETAVPSRVGCADHGGRPAGGAVECVSRQQRYCAGHSRQQSALFVDEGNGASFTVKLAAQPIDSIVLVVVNSSDHGAVTLDSDERAVDYQSHVDVAFGPNSWDEGRTITVTGVSDSIDQLVLVAGAGFEPATFGL